MGAETNGSEEQLAAWIVAATAALIVLLTHLGSFHGDSSISSPRSTQRRWPLDVELPALDVVVEQIRVATPGNEGLKDPIGVLIG